MCCPRSPPLNWNFSDESQSTSRTISGAVFSFSISQKHKSMHAKKWSIKVLQIWPGGVVKAIQTEQNRRYRVVWVGIICHPCTSLYMCMLQLNIQVFMRWTALVNFASLSYLLQSVVKKPFHSPVSSIQFQWWTPAKWFNQKRWCSTFIRFGSTDKWKEHM